MRDKPKKQMVLDILLDRRRVEGKDGGWVDGHVLCEPWTGGTSGLRRVRELRTDGWVVEKRRKPGSDEFQYRVNGRDRTAIPT